MHGGISLKGPSHEVNQDFFWCSSGINEGVVAISDGVSSLKKSQFGAQAFCNCVSDIWHLSDQDFSKIVEEPQKLCLDLNEQWIQSVTSQGLSPLDCCATGLFAFARNGLLTMGACGDGFVSILADNDSFVLLDDKKEKYCNETDCLLQNPEMTKWRVIQHNYSSLLTIIACTDGVYINPFEENTIKAFTKDFYCGYKSWSIEKIKNHINNWLINWPENDDKTIAFCIGN